MAEIATFSCVASKCRFTVRLASDFPLWHKDTPQTLRVLPVRKDAEKYVTGYRSDTYCLDCKSVTTLGESPLCNACGSVLHQDLSSKLCAQCKRAQVNLTHLIVR